MLVDKELACQGKSGLSGPGDTDTHQQGVRGQQLPRSETETLAPCRTDTSTQATTSSEATLDA